MDLNQKLEGERIYLQKPEVSFEFALKMFKVVDANRDFVIPWLAWALPEITQSAEDDFSYALEADKAWKNGERFEYVIYNKENKDFLGTIALIKRGNEKNKAFEIGYWLKKDAQGNGYIQEAIKLVENEFFSNGIIRLTIRADVENEKSNNVAKKAGYTFEGTLKKSQYNMCLHEFRDMNLYSKIKE